MVRRARSIVWIAVIGTLAGAPAMADVKIAYIDPLSGGAASAGILGAEALQFYVDKINAAGGVNGQKLELVAFDNKVNPQESLIILKKVLDDGIRYVAQGNGSAGRARHHGRRAQVQRAQPRQGGPLPQLRRRRPGADQREVQLLALPLRRRRRHEDGSPDQLHGQAAEDQEGLPDQPGLFLRQGGGRGGAHDAHRQAPRHRDRGRRAAPAAEGAGLLARTSPRSRPPAPTPSSPATGATTCCS